VILVVTAAGVGFLTLPYAMRRIGRKLRPGQWAVLCAVALLVGAALALGSVLLIAAPPMFDVVGLPVVARTCQRMLGNLYPGGTVSTTVAAVLVLSAVGLGGRALIHAHRCVQHARAGSSASTSVGRHGLFEILMVPDDRRFAMSVPGRCGGQMLISRGAVDALSPSELQLVCAHEAAHLRLGHRRYLVLAVLVEEAFWFWPPTKGSTRTLRLALERWADEVAAGDSSESRGRLRGALLIVAGVTPPASMAAFSAVDGFMERLNALEVSPRRAHPGWWFLVLAPGILVGLVTVYAGSRLGHQAYCLMTMPGRCLSR
jgi:hypothetical protein